MRIITPTIGIVIYIRVHTHTYTYPSYLPTLLTYDLLAMARIILQLTHYDVIHRLIERSLLDILLFVQFYNLQYNSNATSNNLTELCSMVAI